MVSTDTYLFVFSLVLFCFIVGGIKKNMEVFPMKRVHESRFSCVTGVFVGDLHHCLILRTKACHSFVTGLSLGNKSFLFVFL